MLKDSSRSMFILVCLIGAFLSCHAQQSPSGNVSLTEQQKDLGAKLAGVTKSYLEKKIGLAAFGGKPFCGYRLLDVEDHGSRVTEYVNAICQEFYLKGNGRLEKGTGVALPLALTIARGDDGFEVLSHQEPRDGNEFKPDVEKIFPQRVQPEILSNSQWREAMMQQISADAEKYFATGPQNQSR